MASLPGAGSGHGCRKLPGSPLTWLRYHATLWHKAAVSCFSDLRQKGFVSAQWPRDCHCTSMDFLNLPNLNLNPELKLVCSPGMTAFVSKSTISGLPPKGDRTLHMVKKGVSTQLVDGSIHVRSKNIGRPQCV